MIAAGVEKAVDLDSPIKHPLELICEAEVDEVLINTDTRGVIRVTLNRPERRNALTVAMMERIAKVFATAERDRDVRAIVITAAGDRAFCAGADLTPGDTPFQPDFAQLRLPFADLLRAGHASPVPVICAFNGACVAGGMGFFGLCDVALAASTARFGMTEVKVGIFPMQIVAVLRDLIAPRLMADLAMTGRLMGAEEALERGLVNAVVPPEDLPAAVDEWVAAILAVSPVAIRRGKYALRAMAAMDFERMIAFAETQVGPMIMTADAREGMQAFNEKRLPVWPNA